MKPSLYAVLAALALGSIAVQAKDASAPKMAVKALSGVPAAELPAAAAKAVMQAPKDAQVATVEAVIRKIGRTNPAALRLVVAALAKEDPSLAALAAGAASKSNPESVALFAAAACGAAPQKAHEVIAVCARGSALDRTSLSDMVATIEPSYAADALSVEGEAIDTSSSAAVIRGGTVIAPRPIPGQVGITMNGEAVTVAPTAVGPGRPGFDPDRYARGGN